MPMVLLFVAYRKLVELLLVSGAVRMVCPWAPNGVPVGCLFGCLWDSCWLPIGCLLDSFRIIVGFRFGSDGLPM